jgi:hypothetical protein
MKKYLIAAILIVGFATPALAEEISRVAAHNSVSNCCSTDAFEPRGISLVFF